MLFQIAVGSSVYRHDVCSRPSVRDQGIYPEWQIKRFGYRVQLAYFIMLASIRLSQRYWLRRASNESKCTKSNNEQGMLYQINHIHIYKVVLPLLLNI
jgi:intergrase/recombinase